MASIDLRTRGAADVREVDPAAFLDGELPHLFAERGDLAVAAARQMRLRPLALVVADRTWVLDLDGDRFLVRGDGSGAAPHTVVGLDAEQVADLVNDLRTPVGFLAGGDLDVRAGRLEALLGWWVVLRAVVDGRRAYTARQMVTGPLTT